MWIDDDGVLNLGDAEVVTVCRHVFDRYLGCGWIKVVVPC